MHAASGSHSSSNSSLRKKRLGEIAEEEEEEQRASKRQSILEDSEVPKPSDEPSSPTVPVTLNAELAASPEQSNFAAPTTSEVPKFVGVDERPTSPSESVDDRRNSSQSARPDMFSYSQYNYGKPKVKIGPRPSVDATGRPRTAGNYRPVSQIPSGFKVFGKGHKKGGSKDKHDDFTAPPADDTIATTTISIPEDSHLDIVRPATSSGVSTRSSILPTPMSPTKPTITPEKARLMKAMKLREKKKKMALQSSSDAPAPAIDSPASIEEVPEEKLDDADVTVDSGIVLEASSSSVTTDRASEDSHPASPVIASSEPDQSTKASSVSESTDETVQAKSEDAAEQDDEDDTPEEKSGQKSVPIEDSPTIPDTLFKPMPMKIATPDMGGIEEASDEESSTADEEESAPVSRLETAEKTDEEVVSVANPPLRIPTPPLPNTNEPKTKEIPDAPETKETDDAFVNKAAPLPSPPLKIPKSKFSTQDLRSEARGSPIPTISTPVEQNWREESPLETTEAANPEQGEQEKQGSDLGAPVTELKPPKRRAFVEPIRTDLDAHSRSDANISDDESLMEELQSATVHEAKSMLVAKSPVTPVFPSPTKGGARPHIVRTASNPVRGPLLTPNDVTQNSARSLSSGAAYLHKVTQQQQVGNLAAKTNVGSSISQRIKALEKLSSSTGEGPSTLAPSRERPSSTFFSVRKGREPSRSPSVVDRASSFTRQAQTPPSRTGSRDGSSLENSWHSRRERSGSVTSRLSMFEAFPNEALPPSGNTSRGRPETISVTAKIVRAATTLEPPKDPSEYNHLDLKQSPLVVDHQKATPPPQWTPLASETKETIQERRLSRDSRRAESPEKSRRSSLSVVKDFIKESRKSLTSPSSDALAAPSPPSSSRSPTRSPPVQQHSSFTHRLSISSRRSSFSRDRENVLSPSTTTEGSGSGDEKSEKKKSSRAGRFMRRLSTLSSGKGKASPPNDTPTVAEEELVEPKPRAKATAPPPAQQPTVSTPSIVSYMGDVNVQFPDTLLWKRRNLCLDSQGFLILSAQPAQNGRPAQATKRYHLSEFRAPYIPDIEVQELPNSIVLDLIEGSGVQVACEDRAGQGNVLKSKS